KHKIYLKLGYINLKLKKLNEAKHYFESAIEWKQKTYGAPYPEAHYALAQYYVKTGDKEAARQEFQIALEQNPDLHWEKELADELGVEVEVPDEDLGEIF
ncbi:MAG: tetratricopeptide repeat protein, partial [Calditrichaeota bacterium]